MKRLHKQTWCLGVGLILLLLLAACRQETPPVTPVVEEPPPAPTQKVVAAATMAAPATETAVPIVPPTWTPAPTLPPPPSSTPLPTITQAPTDTPVPLPTNTATATATSLPTETPVPATNTPAPPAPTSPPPPPPPPTTAPDAVLGVNILPNGSFEDGWYNKDGIPELQLPNGWTFDWDTGPTGFGTQSWDVYVRPETRVLPAAQIPPAEHPLFIYDGNYTVKIFKGSGAISFRMYRDLTLEPGTYRFEVNVFPDQVMGYNNGEKVWADDPLAGELLMWAGDFSTGWQQLAFGQRNTLPFDFTITETQNVRLGIWGRGRYALPQDGFFFDAFSLKRIG